MKALVVPLLAGWTVLQTPVAQLDPAWAVVLPADSWRRYMYIPCSRDEPPRSEYWAPGSETIGPLEIALSLALQRALDEKLKGRAARPASSDYYRQYVGIRVSGRPVIYINGFHRSHVERSAPESVESWRTQVVNVCDGGAFYFGAEYDPATGHVTNIRFNGAG